MSSWTGCGPCSEALAHQSSGSPTEKNPPAQQPVSAGGEVVVGRVEACRTVIEEWGHQRHERAVRPVW